MNYKAVIWYFGGVITSSPFEAFNKFELDNNLPKDIIRTINLCNHKFHRACIDIWFEKKNNCPICRCQLNV